MKLNKDKVIHIVKAALMEDIGSKDITTDFLIPKNLKIKAGIVLKEDGIVAGLDIAKWIFKLVDRKIEFKSLFKDGDEAGNGTVIAELRGPASGILTAERTALNFLARLSGIATQTSQFVKKVNLNKAASRKGNKTNTVKIMDTRKTTPLLRYLEKYAVRVGGGFNHRMGLWEQILIKDNHLRILEKDGQSICDVIKLAQKNALRNIKVEVEVENITQFKKALNAQPDIIMLDNWNIKDIKEAVRLKNSFKNCKSIIEVSGGVNLKNVGNIAKTKVNAISIGLLTHSVRSLDIAMEVIG